MEKVLHFPCKHKNRNWLVVLYEYIVPGILYLKNRFIVIVSVSQQQNMLLGIRNSNGSLTTSCSKGAIKSEKRKQLIFTGTDW